MRMIVLLSLLLSAAAGAHEEAKGHHEKATVIEPVEQLAAGAVYGARLPVGVPHAVALDIAAANPGAHAGKFAAYSGRITEVCQKMGCWVVLAGENGQFARVTMHEHSFGVPKDTAGPAIVYGSLSEHALDKEEIEHLRKDGAAEPAASELRIDALSVLIPKSS
ncbi:MAG: DUF4920 domain-containing protein [Dokdonella sp.]|uniref:DUF4920 domain-containing protein n=1 Tax=Dokdonella sp. TaxID=2291710 RepID=UPI002BF43AD2|nr:DUF4920 domain-containing protein [Dokdonella sp.]HOX72194.1 DUF4920 domain-containing protein [Dokdonella sp.]HPG93656.1 DUF4920 domain-containing protein [Dokdonella sp.]HPN79954.1 DUF4920 domain-containing protein [Dokdonella sp.]